MMHSEPPNITSSAPTARRQSLAGPSSMAVHPHIPAHHIHSLPQPPLHPSSGPANQNPLNVLAPIDIHQDLDLQPHAGHSDQLISFFESLDSMPDPDVHPDPTPAIWDSFNFAPTPPAPQWEQEVVQNGPGSGPARLRHCDKPEHASGGCDCTGPSPLCGCFLRGAAARDAEFLTRFADAALNEEFFRSLPNPVREIVKMRTGDVAASHDLTRAASMAMVLLYRARQAEGGAEAQALLIKQSDHYFQQAVMHLETATIPLEAQLIAMADMQVRSGSPLSLPHSS